MNPKGRSSPRFLIASVILFASAAVAAAQTTTAPAAPSAPGWGRHGDHRDGPQNWQAERAQMEERRLAELHTKLNLKPGQEPAWQVFVTGLQAARPTPKPHERPDWETMKTETTPQRLDHMLARIDDMHAHLAQLDQAVKAFYARLSKDQQTIFDDNFKSMEFRHGGPGGWMHGRGEMDHGPMDYGRGAHGPMGPPGMGPEGGPAMMGGPPPQM